VKIALSTQQIAPVYPSKPVHLENKWISIPEKKDTDEFRDVLLQAHQTAQKMALIDIYQRVTEKTAASSNNAAKPIEFEIYQYDAKRELNIKGYTAARRLDIVV